MIICAQNIKKSYTTKSEKITVINNLNLNIYSPEIISIMGPSGAGKSTLLHILGTIDNFDSGNLTIESEKIYPHKDYSKFRSKNIGFVFQFHHLLNELSVLENLIIPQILLSKDKVSNKNIALGLLNDLELIHLKDRYPNQISGGERQRVAIIRAIVNKPRILFADEPTGNLDQGNSTKILELFNKIKNKYKMAILIATHDQSIRKFANRNFLLRDGVLKKK